MTLEPLKDKLVDKYPEDIFIEPTKEQWDKIHELCNKEIGKPFDGFAGSISRHVLRNCIEDVRSAAEGCKQELIKHRNHYRKSNPAIANFIDSFLVDFDKWFEDVIE